MYVYNNKGKPCLPAYPSISPPLCHAQGSYISTLTYMAPQVSTTSGVVTLGQYYNLTCTTSISPTPSRSLVSSRPKCPSSWTSILQKVFMTISTMRTETGTIRPMTLSFFCDLESLKVSSCLPHHSLAHIPPLC